MPLHGILKNIHNIYKKGTSWSKPFTILHSQIIPLDNISTEYFVWLHFFYKLKKWPRTCTGTATFRNTKNTYEQFTKIIWIEHIPLKISKLSVNNKEMLKLQNKLGLSFKTNKRGRTVPHTTDTPQCCIIQHSSKWHLMNTYCTGLFILSL